MQPAPSSLLPPPPSLSLYQHHRHHHCHHYWCWTTTMHQAWDRTFPFMLPLNSLNNPQDYSFIILLWEKRGYRLHEVASGSQTQLCIKMTWGLFKNADTWVSHKSYWTRNSTDGSQAAGNLFSSSTDGYPEQADLQMTGLSNFPKVA